MEIEIMNSGSGAKIGAHVDQNNQLHTASLSKSETQDATRKGNGYNINTGWISITAAGHSGMFYLKNNEPPANGEASIFIESIIVATDGLGTTTANDPVEVIIYSNPTGGTLISGATDVDYKANRNFGSSNVLDPATLVYKGASGSTITGGTGVALLAQNINTRISYPINIELPKGASIGISIDPKRTAGTVKGYIAVICYRVDGKNS